MNDIMVSVICLAFNHEKYIRKCLDGFVMQQGVSFEVLINDDASTDKTADIIKEYEQKYPDIIHPIYQTENQYSKGILAEYILLSKTTGKYIAFCEGDDYWTDPFKLQKQVAVMEQHPECHLCVHAVPFINEDGSENGGCYPVEPLPTGFIPEAEYFRLIENYNFQTSSYLFRAADFWEYTHPLPEFAQISAATDACMLLYFGGLLGNVFYLNEPMSRYRLNSSGSWNQTLTANGASAKIRYYHDLIRVVDAFDVYTNGRFSEFLKLRNLKSQFYIAHLSSDYKTMIRPEYREFLKTESRKYRAFVFLAARCPIITKLLKK